MTTRLQHRIDSALKEDAEAILQQQGFKPSQAITLFYTEIKRRGGLPFTPSRVLERELETIKDKKGIKSYKNKRDFFDQLDKL